ncbi:MAG: DUF4412 domain-containing protein [Bacteroidales bacterium]|nr:DUF4412 domain-containing protein [Bacteroidales bacterium]
MKRIIFIISLIFISLTSPAQQRLLYKSFTTGGQDTSWTEVIRSSDLVRIMSADAPPQNPIPGIAQSSTYINYATDSVYARLKYPDGAYYTSYPINHRGGIVGTAESQEENYTKEGSEKINGYKCDKYTITLFSNKIEVWVTEDLKFKATPASGFADLPGVLVQYRRNGNAYMQLASVKKFKITEPLFETGQRVTSRVLSSMEKDRKIITHTIFQDDQICFNPKLPRPTEFPYDSVIRCANGTMIVKRVHLDRMPEHYQVFAEVTEYSNGDAYDRTGSIFIIPADKAKSMIQALRDSVEVLPYFTDKKGGVYQGMIRTNDYDPVVEMVRFFTPFGVRHYNEYRSLGDRDWAKEVYYKQDVTELLPLLAGDVYIGAFIGNYDGGGHKLSLTLKAYPEGEAWEFSKDHEYRVEPLFNTCNVMEMAGQNYGRFFLTDSLTVTFNVPENMEELELRYITTGHGGWGGGDEFVPKENTILIDGKPYYSFTPWREDCGTYRTSNPASGNFWNGMSSSDYSRSGWCPGTATQPVHINLSGLKPGQHTMTVAIPEGEPEGGSFSAWNVSGVLIGQYRK